MNLRHTGQVRENEIVVGDRNMAAKAFLNEAGIFAVRLVFPADEAGESPPPGLLVFPGISKIVISTGLLSIDGHFFRISG